MNITVQPCIKAEEGNRNLEPILQPILRKLLLIPFLAGYTLYWTFIRPHDNRADYVLRQDGSLLSKLSYFDICLKYFDHYVYYHIM